MEDKLTNEKIEVAQKYNSDPDRDIFGMSDNDYNMAYGTDDDLNDKYLDQLAQIDAQIDSINERITKMKNSYNSEVHAAAEYYEERFNIDPDETYISLGDFKDFKKVNGDTFKTSDTYDKKLLEELYSQLKDLRKMRNHVIYNIGEVDSFGSSSVKR